MAEIKSYPNNVNVEIGAENVMRWHHGRTSGVFGAPGELAVAALTTPAMAVTVSDGDGWLTDSYGNGIHFWNDVFASTASLLQLPIATADGVLNRIDRIIVEWSTPNYTQLPEIKVLKGISAVSPVAPVLTNNVALRQISLARISVAAGTLAITAGMIADERFEDSVCGVVTETTKVDTSMAAAQFTEVLTAAQNLVNNLQGEAVVDHAATHEPGGDDVAKFVFYGGEQELTEEQKTQARANMGAGKPALIFTGKQVLTSAWVTDPENMYSTHPKRATVSECAGISANHVAMVVFGQADIDLDLYSFNCKTGADVVYIYARSTPATTLTIPTIIAWG